MDLAQNKLVVAVAAPTPVPAPIPAPAPATIPVALTGWSPSTITELEAAGVSEVSADPRKLVYMPAPAPVHAPPPTVTPAPVRLAAPAAPVRAPPPTAAPVPVRLAAPAAPVPLPVRTPPQWHGTLPSTATSQRRQLPSSRAPPVDRTTT